MSYVNFSRKSDGCYEFSDFDERRHLQYFFYNYTFWQYEFRAFVSPSEVLCRDAAGEIYICTLAEAELPENNPVFNFFEIQGASTFFRIKKLVARKK